MSARVTDAMLAAKWAHGTRHELTVAGRIELIAIGMRALSQALAKGEIPENASRCLQRWSEDVDAAARELRDPVVRPAGRAD